MSLPRHRLVRIGDEAEGVRDARSRRGVLQRVLQAGHSKVTIQPAAHDAKAHIPAAFVSKAARRVHDDLVASRRIGRTERRSLLPAALPLFCGVLRASRRLKASPARRSEPVAISKPGWSSDCALGSRRRRRVVLHATGTATVLVFRSPHHCPAARCPTYRPGPYFPPPRHGVQAHPPCHRSRDCQPERTSRFFRVACWSHIRSQISRRLLSLEKTRSIGRGQGGTSEKTSRAKKWYIFRACGRVIELGFLWSLGVSARRAGGGAAARCCENGLRFN